MSTWRWWAAIAIGVCLGSGVTAQAQVQSVAPGKPDVVVVGPLLARRLPLSDRAYPFGSTLQSLEAAGYIEQEFFVSGQANRYRVSATTTAVVIDSGHSYTTRIVVRRPTDPAAFNGSVVLEWNNVTAGYDIETEWLQMSEHLMRSGYAWVGVTAQQTGAEALKVWNPARYKSMSIPSDDLSYDIFSDAARSVRRSLNSPLGPLHPARIIAVGHSQSAGRLNLYVNSVHPRSGAVDGVFLHGGGALRIENGAAVREAVGVPVWKLLSETEIPNQAVNRQADTPSFRSWEVAGSSHIDVRLAGLIRTLAERDGTPYPSGLGSQRLGLAPPDAAGECSEQPYSRVPFRFVMHAALDHMVRWIRDKIPPPSAPPIETPSVGPPATIARDANGNALGGIQLPEHGHQATNSGINSGPGLCALYGSHRPFGSATINQFYTDREDVIAVIRKSIDANISAGYLSNPDAELIAQQTGIAEEHP